MSIIVSALGFPMPSSDTPQGRILAEILGMTERVIGGKIKDFKPYEVLKLEKQFQLIGFTSSGFTEYTKFAKKYLGSNFTPVHQSVIDNIYDNRDEAVRGINMLKMITIAEHVPSDIKHQRDDMWYTSGIRCDDWGSVLLLDGKEVAKILYIIGKCFNEVEKSEI